jgi:hypothetical protein
MQFHINKCDYRIGKNIKAYCIGKSIIFSHVRYLDNGECNGMMFHSLVMNSYGHCYTFGCDRMDFSGLCPGHKMSREEFIERYCGGVEPGVSINEEDKEV